jgi:hypothetical protein
VAQRMRGETTVGHTGVKSFGCEKSTAQELPIQSWKRILPSVVCASKSGAVSLIARVITPLRYMRERDGLGTGYIPNGVVLSEHKNAARSMPAFDPGGFRFSKHKFEKCRGRSD